MYIIFLIRVMKIYFTVLNVWKKNEKYFMRFIDHLTQTFSTLVKCFLTHICAVTFNDS